MAAPGAGGVAAPGTGAGGTTGVAARASATSASRSAWKRPDAVSSPSAMRRTALATIAPPSATSDASCGHVETLSRTSTSDAAIRSDRLAASMIRSTYGTFCLVVRPRSSAEPTPPSSPWNGSRPGSRSKRSTSSIPRWLVAMTTGRRAARACSRSATFISSPSHSSTITSAPATNAAIVSSSTPRSYATTRT